MARTRLAGHPIILNRWFPLVSRSVPAHPKSHDTGWYPLVSRSFPARFPLVSQSPVYTGDGAGMSGKRAGNERETSGYHPVPCDFG